MDFVPEHFYQHFFYVEPIMKCSHGEGRTFPDPDGHGVKIECPAGNDCWFMKWQNA